MFLLLIQRDNLPSKFLNFTRRNRSSSRSCRIIPSISFFYLRSHKLIFIHLFLKLFLTILHLNHPIFQLNQLIFKFIKYKSHLLLHFLLHFVELIFQHQFYLCQFLRSLVLRINTSSISSISYWIFSKSLIFLFQRIISILLLLQQSLNSLNLHHQKTKSLLVLPYLSLLVPRISTFCQFLIFLKQLSIRILNFLLQS